MRDCLKLRQLFQVTPAFGQAAQDYDTQCYDICHAKLCYVKHIMYICDNPPKVVLRLTSSEKMLNTHDQLLVYRPLTNRVNVFDNHNIWPIEQNMQKDPFNYLYI